MRLPWAPESTRTDRCVRTGAGTFGTVAWHPSSHALVYVAEAPSLSPSPDPSARPTKDKFVYTADWGETFTGKKSPTLFLLVLPGSPFASLLSYSSKAPTIHRLTRAGKTSFGQPAFLPDSHDGKPRLVATGYDELDDGRKLGVVYCTNRRARVLVLEVGVGEKEKEGEGEGEREQTFEVTNTIPVSSPDRSARSPRVVPSAPDAAQTQIVYLSNILGSVHASCAQLHVATLFSSSSSDVQDRILVPQVDSPTPANDFPGLYIDQLPLEPFVRFPTGSSGWSIVTSSSWRSRRVPLRIDLDSGAVSSLAPWPAAQVEKDAALPYLGAGDELESFGVLGTDRGTRVVGVRSGCGRVGRVVVADLGAGHERVEWKVVREAGVSDRRAFGILLLPSFDVRDRELMMMMDDRARPQSPPPFPASRTRSSRCRTLSPPSSSSSLRSRSTRPPSRAQTSHR